MNESNFYDLFKNFSLELLNNALITACNYGELDKVKYLLTSPELKIYPDINYHHGIPLSYACMNEHMDIIKYILTSSEITNHADIHINNENALYTAANNGSFDLIKYLISSPDLKDYANIHYDKDIAFTILVDNEETDIITYLIFDYKIEKTIDISNYLNDKPTNFKKEINELFNKRELLITLEKDLSSDTINKKKIKL